MIQDVLQLIFTLLNEFAGLTALAKKLNWLKPRQLHLSLSYCIKSPWFHYICALIPHKNNKV